MGNHRFRLSDMMPNAWFYKLRDMRKPNNQKPTKSFYDQTIKSSAKPTRRRAIYMPSTRKDTNFTIFAAAANEVRAQSDDHHSSLDDIVINIDDKSLHLPPIVTKPTTKQSPIQKSPKSFEMPKEDGAVRSKKTSRKSGVKIRANRNGRKFAGKKSESGGQKNVKREKRCLFYSQSFALVKSSFDPERDFQDSMMEMIVENGIRELKDLEDLLACYLSLNSNRYHDAIIRAFEQIWFAMKE